MQRTYYVVGIDGEWAIHERGSADFLDRHTSRRGAVRAALELARRTGARVRVQRGERRWLSAATLAYSTRRAVRPGVFCGDGAELAVLRAS